MKGGQHAAASLPAADPQVNRRVTRRGVRRSLGRAAMYLAMVVAVAMFAFPLLWIVLTSFKTRLDILHDPPLFFFRGTLDNYKALLEDGFTKYLLNSVIVVACSTILAVGIGSFAAYALARYKTRASNQTGFWILSQRMFPPISIIIPLFLIMNAVMLKNTLFSVILVYTLFNLPLAVWVMKSFFEEIPVELEESAMIDGHSFFTTFRRVILPLAAPGIVTATVLSVIFTWNEFLFALILTNENTKTMPVAAITYIGARGVEWGKMTAAATVIMLPILVLLLFIHKRLAKGLTYGAIKG